MQAHRELPTAACPTQPTVAHFSYCLQIHSEASKTQIQLLHFSESLAMSERPAGTPSWQWCNFRNISSPIIFFGLWIISSHVKVGGIKVGGIKMGPYGPIWAHFYSTHFYSTHFYMATNYGIPHGNTTTLAAILSCRSWHLRIGT